MRLSDIQGWHVETEQGDKLGHVFDLRCDGAPTRGRSRDSANVVALVYGTVGLLERLGLRSARECELRWRDVVALRDGSVIVRASAAQRARKRR